MEGRHVGLDFYDLLIEVLYRMRPVLESDGRFWRRRGASDTAV